MGFCSGSLCSHLRYSRFGQQCISARTGFQWRKSCSRVTTFQFIYHIRKFIGNAYPDIHQKQTCPTSHLIYPILTDIIKIIASLYTMRILVQRVFESWVKVSGIQISRIKEGLLVLVGITHDDNPDVADHMVSKILNMRLWEKDGKTWNGSVMDIQGQIMVVSQFTLYGILKGNKPDFHASMEADKAKQLFNYVVEELGNKYSPDRIRTGKFQALMEVGSVINGPVTIEYEKAADQMQKKKPKILNKAKKQEQVETKGEEEKATKQEKTSQERQQTTQKQQN